MSSGVARRRLAVVTGGAGDIGQAIGRQLADDGFMVVLADILDQGAGDTIAASLDSAVVYRRIDVTDYQAMVRMMEDLPNLDVVVANAGMVDAAPFLDIGPEQWRRHLDVNLTGAFFTAQAAARRMVRDGVKGHIVFTSSWVAERPWPGIAAYASSKAGMNQLMRQIALELSPYGIRANAVAPGIVKAGMAKKQLEEEPDYAARAATAVPLGELQTAVQIAEAVGFLASSAARTMDGAVLLLDNGSSLGTMTA